MPQSQFQFVENSHVSSCILEQGFDKVMGMVVWADEHGCARLLVDPWVFHIIVDIFVVAQNRIGVPAFGEIEQEAVDPQFLAERMRLKVILYGKLAADRPNRLDEDIFLVIRGRNLVRHLGILKNK
jgi:hypothetical protein